MFRYVGFEVDAATSTLHCHYAVGGHEFTERVTLDDSAGDLDWSADGVDDAARLVFLLAGVSYHKAFAPEQLDLGDTPVTDGERAFLRDFYVHGLGEFAHRNGLDLSGITITGGATASDRRTAAAPTAVRPLVPFGGGMDSFVSVELVKAATPDASLFVVGRYDAIEDAARTTGLPVRRATRTLDPEILRSDEHGWRNGHVPVTGIISAIAVLAAAASHHDSVIMSNEWSASQGNITLDDGRTVNHQWSKGAAFEAAFRELTHPVSYFSLLRPFSELWIARRFAEHGGPQQRRSFRSCNRAFHVDPAARLDRWCGRCDKCAFIDLVLAPFLDAAELDAIFDGAEPLASSDLLDVFRSLVATSDGAKPFECVGDVDECRVAAALAAERPDRSGNVVLGKLLAEIGGEVPDAAPLLRPMGTHFVPEPHASAAGLG